MSILIDESTKIITQGFTGKNGTFHSEQALAYALPAMLRTQARILAPLTERQRAEFMRLLLRLVDENNDLSRAPSEASER